MNPRISVIISTYKSEVFIHGRLQNLVQQTAFPESEIIVVNSGSPQGEERIVKEFQKKYDNILYYATPHRETIYKAWNRGIAMARGKYVTNANTDDLLRRDALDVLANELDSHPQVAMVYTDQYITPIANSSFEASTHCERFHRRRYSRLWLMYKYTLGSQPMWRASLHFDDGIWFDEEYEVAGDYDFALRVAEQYQLLRIPGVIGVYYRPEDKSNKEYQDSDRTHHETFEIQQKYARRYVASMPREEFARLYRAMRFWVAVPRRVYTILHRTIDLVDKEKQIFNRMFWCWFGSLMEEHRGDFEESKRLCRKCLDIRSPYTEMLRLQYQHLQSES